MLKNKDMTDKTVNESAAAAMGFY